MRPYGELELLSLEELRKFRAEDYGESLSTYSKSELLQLILDTWITDGCKALAAMTKEEIIDEIVGDVELDDTPEMVEGEIGLFIEAVRQFAAERA